MCRLIKLHTRGYVGSQIWLAGCVSIGKYVAQLILLVWGWVGWMAKSKSGFGCQGIVGRWDCRVCGRSNPLAAQTHSLTWPSTWPNPHTNKVSCTMYFPMDTQPANQIWLPTQPRVCNLINLHIRSHLYTTAETTIHNNPLHHTTHLTKHENRRTYRPANTRHIWKQHCPLLQHYTTRKKITLSLQLLRMAQGGPKHVEQLIKEK